VLSYPDAKVHKTLSIKTKHCPCDVLINQTLVIVLKKLEPSDIEKILQRALDDQSNGFNSLKVQIEDGGECL
jgi:hypothetical protein